MPTSLGGYRVPASSRPFSAIEPAIPPTQIEHKVNYRQSPPYTLGDWWMYEAIRVKELDMDEGLYTVEEAVVYLGLDRLGLSQPRESLRWLCRTGKLEYTKVGRYIMFRREWLDELIDRYATRRPRRSE